MRAPAIRFPAILRPRITEEISRLMSSGADLLLVEAPAGFGKTAALVQWSADEPGTFWLSAEYAQNLGELLQDLPGANMSEGGWEYQAAQPTTVIIDDYEFLTNPDVDRAVAHLLEGSENLRLVVLSRKATLFDTPLVTSRLRVARLRAADLEFTEEECDALAQMRGVGGTPSQWRLLDNVGRWPLGVQAAFSSVVRGVDEAHCATALADGVYRRAGSRPRLQILTAAARFPGVRVRTLARAMEASEVQVGRYRQALEEKGALRLNGDGEGGVGEPLEATVPYLSGQAEQVWDAKKLGYLSEMMALEEEQDDPASSFRILMQDLRLDLAAEVLNRNFAVIVDDGLTLQALREVPVERLGGYPEILMCRVILERADTSQPVAAFDDLVRRLHDSVRTSMVTADGRRMLTLQAYLIAATRMLGNWEEALLLGRDLMLRLGELDLTVSDPHLRIVAPMYLEVARTAYLSGDVALAREAAAAGLEAATIVGDQEERVHALGLLALVHTLSGEGAGASANLTKMDDILRDEGVTQRGVSWVDGEIARVILQTHGGNLDGAQATLQRLSSLAERLEQWPLIVLVEADFASFSQDQMAGLTLLESRLRHWPDHKPLGEHWRSTVLEWQANASVFVGRVAQAQELIDQVHSPELFGVTTRVRLKLVNGDFDGVVGEVTDGLEKAQRPMTRQQLLLYGAVAAGKLQKWDLALKWWSALAKECANLPIWFFSLVPYQWLVENVSDLQQRSGSEEIPCVASQIEALPQPYQMVVLEALTPKESAVLKALGSGRSISAIAEELYVSQNTVKFHLRSVYRKLGVTGRADAVRIAKQVGIL